MEIETKEFEGNVLITISSQEVRLWVCNKDGANIFRFKATGEVHKGERDITVMPKLGGTRRQDNNGGGK